LPVPKRAAAARSRETVSQGVLDSGDDSKENNCNSGILEKDKSLPQVWRLIGTSVYHFVVAFFRMEGSTEWWVVFREVSPHSMPMYGERWVEFIRKRERRK
jgi:hypothetical protein